MLTFMKQCRCLKNFEISLVDYCARTVASFSQILMPQPVFGSCTPIEQILQTNPDSVVVVDEAYVDFGGDRQFDSLIVSTTYSLSIRFLNLVLLLVCVSVLPLANPI